MIVAVDPGLCAGVAAGDAATGPFTASLALDVRPAPGTARAVIELPQVYPNGKARPNDLITLAVNVGRWAEAFKKEGARVYLVRPHTWKGNVPQNIHEARIQERTHKWLYGPRIWEELQAYPVSTRHNAIDALGLLLWAIENERRLEDFRFI